MSSMCRWTACTVKKALLFSLHQRQMWPSPTFSSKTTVIPWIKLNEFIFEGSNITCQILSVQRINVYVHVNTSEESSMSLYCYSDVTKVWNEAFKVNDELEVRNEEAVRAHHVINVVIEWVRHVTAKQTLLQSECFSTPVLTRLRVRVCKSEESLQEFFSSNH